MPRFVIQRGIKYWGQPGMGWTYSPTLAQEYIDVPTAEIDRVRVSERTGFLIAAMTVIPSPVKRDG